ncbi:MAG: TetR/AcrR family transcriptional regulator [Deltaproteobacteria bacterium]|nr:TetR/AcrR family transcriptional regulator [Deltaproteobacteria bacterium]
MVTDLDVAPGDLVQSRILAAGRSLFAAEGCRATSVRAIAAAAETTKPMVYYYFGSKEGLFRAVVADVIQQVETTCRTVCAASMTPTEKLFAVARIHQSADGAASLNLRLIASFFADPQQSVGPVAAARARLAEVIATTLKQILAEGVSQGELRPIPAELLTAAWVATLFYAAFDPKGPGQRDLLTLLLDGLRPRASTAGEDPGHP